jgi:hypothetical protein
VHPEVLAAFEQGALQLEIGAAAADGLQPEEAAVIALLEARMGRTLADSLSASLAALH